MKTPPNKSTTPPIAAGQMWQMKSGYVQIMRVGKTLSDYRMMKSLEQKTARSQMGSTKNVEEYLNVNRAKLMPVSDVELVEPVGHAT